VALSRLTKGAVGGCFTLNARIAFGHGCDHPNYVAPSVIPITMNCQPRNNMGASKIPTMKSHQTFSTFIVVLIFIAGAMIAIAQPSNSVAKIPLYSPDYSRANQPLPDGVLAWDAVTKSVDAMDSQRAAQFTFSFTNISGATVTILNVHPSCGCTTAQLPPVPWRIPAGSSGQIELTVNMQGHSGTMLKTVNVSTDKGGKMLIMRINILAQSIPKITEAERAADITVAKRDRQAVFKGNCASCHARDIQGRYGKELYDTACAVCHDANPRASMVPDLHSLKEPTSVAFWRSWIVSGKAGTLMPAFAASQGGPLSDMQIDTLASYLNAAVPSDLQPTPAKSQIQMVPIYQPPILKH
jgi:mono/diheme cytochrome c family protein